jgi:Ca2+-transporting ATPase
MPAAQLCAHLATDPQWGLSESEAAARRARYGPNRLAEAPRPPAWRLLLAQFEDFMVLVLLGAAAVSLVLGERADAAAVLAIVSVNAVLGFLQESRAERSLEALRRLTAPVARVLREGRVRSVPAEELVPGDILLLEAGDRVPADARLLEATALAAEEAALTGESRPVAKDPAPLSPPSVASPRPARPAARRRDQSAPGGPTSWSAVPPAERRNAVFQGSHVVRGRGRAVVLATGMATEVGRIAGLILDAPEGQTPLQRRLDALGRWLVVGCLGISAVVVVAGVLRGEPPYRMFLAGVSLAVAAIPEGLPAIVTIALALGVQRMIARRAVVRRLPAVETLGCATVICADKTGTLTQNAMAVAEVWAAGRRWRVEGGTLVPAEGRPAVDRRAAPAAAGGAEPALRRCVACAVLCNDAAPDPAAPGADPTEVALLGLAAAAGVEAAELRAAAPRLAEVPFDAERRRMAVAVAEAGSTRVYVKGALEEVLGRAAWVLAGAGRQPLDARWTARIRQEGERMAGAALRVLALAERELPRLALPARAEELERDLTFCGLVGIWDPPRPEVPAAVRRCQQAGVRAVMITGDHALTARAIAAQVGLLRPGGRVVTGSELGAVGDRELAVLVEEADVFARVSPADKLRIVQALRARGHVVAMTGDGVNDAPALKEADIGVAMGRCGTDVARESSHLVLMDDNFATIVAAIEEGRAIYDNIRKFIRYLLACNTGEVLVMLAGTLLGLPLPLLPLQLLLVNLVTDGLPALALGLDPPAPDVMRRPPRDPRESLFAGGLGKRIAARGVLIGVLTLLAFRAVYARLGDLAAARTAATCTLVLSQLLHAFDARAERRTLWEVGLGENRALWGAAASSLLALLAAVYLPGIRQLLHFSPLDGGSWTVVVSAALGGAVLAGAAEALRRAWVRRTTVVRVRRMRAEPGPGPAGR